MGNCLLGPGFGAQVVDDAGEVFAAMPLAIKKTVKFLCVRSEWCFSTGALGRLL